MKEIYFDNSATTSVLPAVRDEILTTLEDNFGNPSSMHRKGWEAEKTVKLAKERIAATLKCKESEICFTSGGTEADNMAIIGGADARKRYGRHLITTAVEHPAVGNTMAHLEKAGYEVTYLPVDSTGTLRLSDLQNAVRPDTTLISVMMVNNEVGARMPIEEIGAWLKAERPDILFHVDAVQGYGKYRINLKKPGIDMLSVSSHKIHGPKGIGFLYLRDKVKIEPIVFGGGQQKGLRSGTENVPGITGIGKAAELAYADFDAHIAHMYELRERLSKGLAAMDGVSLNGPAGKDGAPHIVSASFEGVRAEVLLHALEERGIYVSAGSACASNHPGLSGTLMAIHLRKELLDSTLRFSLNPYNTEEEADLCLAALRELLPALRKYTRR